MPVPLYAEFTKTITDSVSLTDSATVTKPGTYSEDPKDDKNSFYVKDNTGTWQLFDAYEYFRVKKRQNQISEFEIKVYDIQDSQKAYFKEKAEVLFFAGTKMILKGRIQTIEYASAYECIARGYGMEVKLLDKEFIKNNDKRVQYTNTSAQTIIKEIISQNSDGNSPYLIEPASDGIFSSDYGNLSMRFEYANRLKALAKTAEAIDYEWWVSQTSTDTYEEDYIHVAPYQGNTSSVITYDLTSNAIRTSQEKDLNNLVNYVYVLGYGDGINQLKTSTYAASTVSSVLSADIDSTSTTISLNDASSFPASGTIRIAEEIIDYAGKSGNDLTGSSRGVSGSTAKPHKKGVYVEQYFPHTSSQAGSSISTYGLMDYTIIDKTLMNEQTAELIASKYLMERKDPIIRIKIRPDEPMSDVANLDIGDKITINDSEAGLSGEYRIVGMEYVSNYGELTLEIEVSNRNLEFIEQVHKAKEEQENMAKYMQGATNIYAISEAENCDSSHPLNMRFFIPNDAVAINKVKLNFKIKNYRSYESSTLSNYDSSVIYASGRNDAGSSSELPFNSWVSLIGITTSTTSCDGIIFNLGFRGENLSGSAAASTSHWFWARLYDKTHDVYYPDSSGVVIGGHYLAQNDDFSTNSLALGGETTIFVPGNLTGSEFEFQINRAGSSGTAYFKGLGSISYIQISKHTHPIKFEISEETASNIHANLYVGTDGGSMSYIGKYSEGNLDITNQIANVGAGNWANIQFIPLNYETNGSVPPDASSYRALSTESGYASRRANRFTCSADIYEIGFWLYNSQYQNATGPFYYKIWNVSDSSEIASIYVDNAENIPSTPTLVMGTFSSVISLTNNDIYLGIEYSGTNQFFIGYVTDGSVTGSGYEYIGSWGSSDPYRYPFTWSRKTNARIEANAYIKLFIESD